MHLYQNNSPGNELPSKKLGLFKNKSKLFMGTPWFGPSRISGINRLGHVSRKAFAWEKEEEEEEEEILSP